MDTLWRAGLLGIVTCAPLGFTAHAQEGAPPPAEGTADVAPAPAPAPSTATDPTDEALTALSALGCANPSVLRRGDVVYAACGDQGVIVAKRAADGSWSAIETLRTPGHAERILGVGDDVWVAITETSAKRLRDLAPAAPTMPAGTAAGHAAPSASAAAPARALVVGEVIQTTDTEAVISLGAADGLSPGKRVEVYELVSEELAGQSGARERTLFIGEVSSVAAHRARVSFGFAEQPPTGAKVRLSDRRAEGVAIAPERVGGVTEIELGVRPFLPLQELSFAVLGDAAVTYRGEQSYYVRAELRPLGGSTGSGSDVGVIGAYVSGGYDHQYFSVGAGLGALRHRDDDWTRSGVQRDDGFDISITQTARLGARDGLHLSVTNAFVIDDEQWSFGFVDVAGQLPIGTRTWVVAHGGGGEEADYFVAEVGLKRLVLGNGRAGSLFLSPMVGGAGLFGREQSLAGPMIALKAELRL